MWGSGKTAASPVASGAKPGSARLRDQSMIKAQTIKADYAPSKHLSGARGERARNTMAALGLAAEEKAAEEAASAPAGAAPGQQPPSTTPPTAAALAAAAAADAEGREIAELHDLFGGARQSPVPAALFAKFQISCENIAKGEEARREKAVRDAQRHEAARLQYEATQARRARVQNKDNKNKREHAERRLHDAQALREDQKRWAAQVEEHKRELFEDVCVRVSAARSNDARLDRSEEDAAAMLRDEHSKAREIRRIAEVSFKSQIAKIKHKQVEDLKAETQGKVRRSLTNREHQIKEQAKQKRDDAAIGREQMSADEMAFKLKAERAKAYAAESRANAARIKAEMTKQRQMDVTAQDRAASQRVAQAKRALLESNREKRRAVFGSRYVDRDMALTFERSDYKKLYAMDDVADAQIDAANQRLLENLVTVAPKTSDQIDHSAAGAARAEAARVLKARREEENARIERENAALNARLKAVQPKTDVDISDEAVGAARAKAAAASNARRAAEREALAKANAEMQQRIRNTKALTDVDISDEAAGEARVKATAASNARRAAEASALALENESNRKAIDGAVARTDDDLTDEAGWADREKLAAASKARKAGEAAVLEKSNAELREKVKNAKSVIDTDISDEAAGMVMDKADADPHNKGWMGGLFK